jgi:hypothetical protein
MAVKPFSKSVAWLITFGFGVKFKQNVQKLLMLLQRSNNNNK